MNPLALIIKFPGTNCDNETRVSLESVGFQVDVTPSAVLDQLKLEDYQLVVFPGGFSYGDYVMAGRLAALEIRAKIGDKLQNFYQNGGYLLGICNGFQILTQLGFLPKAALIANSPKDRFVCRWSKLSKQSKTPYLALLPDQFEWPVAHAEGRLVIDEKLAKQYEEQGLVALKYEENFNGSQLSIAGLQDKTGRVIGLMPHPERFIEKNQHYNPDWMERKKGWGFYFFQGVFEAISKS